MKKNSKDFSWMDLAIFEAKKSLKTSPNPRVGSLLVKANQLLAKGYHQGPGKAHAEVEVLRQAKEAKGATLFVTLEPCCHEDKRTPPCVPQIIKAGIRRVVVGSRDPNPQVRGKGIAALRRAGIEVIEGVLKEECEALNPFYYYSMKQGLPYVILKMASSLDGKIALANGRSKWITSTQARQHVHQLRSQMDGIVLGVGTVLKDNPLLNVRGVPVSHQPKRIILDPHLKIGLRARVLGSLKHQETWIVCLASSLKKPKAGLLKKKGVFLLPCPVLGNGFFSLKALLKLLAKQGVQSLMVEGGPCTWTEFIRQKTYEEIWHYVAPKFLGGESRSLLGALGLKTLPKQSPLKLIASEKLGEDFYLRYKSL
ncbi:MAG: bifunctional diaminohydroxyphosphoribosylaminopyrimidine deaminase/5-amino-6-(5-phosphoribosylamino)uracil reductase RibD [Deltaproteobacteria bacterium]|nr:bifunctional diaminohydroxyphosphoribosylaminopyrimidine deaminase/5-amino-6-(5-phosphoribosylamino)uracil reductase RibD [Deltaproteobacteria bacterium]